MIEFDYLCYAVVEEPQYTKYLYKLGNYQDFVAELLEVQWTQIFELLSVDDMWSYFHELFTQLVNKHIPTSDTHTLKGAKWMSNSALHKIKLKRKAWIKYKITQADSDFVAYTKCRNEATKAVKACKRCYEKGLVDRISTNPKYFWKYVNSKLKVKNSIAELQRIDGSFTNCDSEMVNILNDYFGTVFTVEDTGEVLSMGDKSSDNCLTTVVILIEDVWHQLTTLDPSKSEGPDGYHPHVLREVKEGVVTPLYLIFKKSLEDGVLPHSWKDALVTALHKKGDKRLPSNYRPVSLTSIICKMMERIIKDHLLQYFIRNKFITSRQHGFRPGHSCETQLIRVLDDWTSALELGHQVDVIYLDLQKAFDKVPHARLLSKLKSYGIGGKLLQWIENFLSNRRQFVHLRGSKSDWINIFSGVPQGSVLGPFLFIVYVNDMPNVVSSDLYMFADDTKLYRTITSESDCNILQQDLNNVIDWGNMWLTNFNLHKCKVLSFGIQVNVRNIYSMSLLVKNICWMELKRKMTWVYYLTLL